MTSKLTPNAARDYWRGVHSQTGDPLAAVCFPGKSRALDACFDRVQSFAVLRAVRGGRSSLQGQRVLEIGCGRGRWLRRLRRLGAFVTGIDLSPEAVAACRTYGLDARVASADDIPSADGTFDLVISVTVLLQLTPDDQRRAASEMIRVCTPGGRILLLEPTAADASPHVWSRPLDGWLSLFPGCRLVYAESHYYMLPLRWFWSHAAGRMPARLVPLLETSAALVSAPLDLALLRMRRGASGGPALQHLMEMRKVAG